MKLDFNQENLDAVSKLFSEGQATKEKAYEAYVKTVETKLARDQKLSDAEKEIELAILKETKLKELGLGQYAPKETSDELLSPTEANLLNVPYGTTRSEAAGMGIIPKSASEIANEGGLTTKQTQTFMTITNKFQADALVQAYDKGQGLSQIADQVIANPDSATNQLKSLYILVKNLDPDSAVREGELALANSTTSYLERFATSFKRLSEGQVIAPQAAKDLAIATKELVGAWAVAKDAREARYTSQANVAGVGDAFQEYLSGTASLSGTTSIEDMAEKAGYDTSEINSLRDAGYSDNDIKQFLEQGFNKELKTSLKTSFPAGSKGGQCTTWLHKVADFPSIGDSISNKIASVQKYGFTKSEWNPKVGDIIVTNEDPRYGHTAMITSINPDGTATLAESNYYQKSLGAEKVSYTRKISLNSSSIYGAIRPKSIKTLA
jgi:hypothetical protein